MSTNDNTEKDLFPKSDDAPVAGVPKRKQKTTINVVRYGRVINGKQICMTPDEQGFYLVPVEKVPGKGEFPLVIDDDVEIVYNWEDDLHKLSGAMVHQAHLALLRLGKTSKEDTLTAQDKAYVARVIAAFLDDLG